MKLIRNLEGELIMDTLVQPATVQTPNSLRILGEVQTLVKSEKATTFRFEIDDPSKLSLTNEPYNDSYNLNRLSIEFEENQITLYVKNNYHLRDFVELIK